MALFLPINRLQRGKATIVLGRPWGQGTGLGSACLVEKHIMVNKVEILGAHTQPKSEISLLLRRLEA